MAKLKYQNPTSIDAELDSIQSGIESNSDGTTTEIRREFVEIGELSGIHDILRGISEHLASIRLVLISLAVETGHAQREDFIDDLEDFN